MFSVLFWLIVGLIIGVAAGAVIFVVGMALVGLIVGAIRLFSEWETRSD